MGDLLDELLKVAGRSVIRHAIVGALTGGVGNVIMALGDMMDLHDTLDAVDAANAVGSSSGGDVHFGGGLDPSTGKYHDSLSGLDYPYQSDYIPGNTDGADPKK